MRDTLGWYVGEGGGGGGGLRLWSAEAAWPGCHGQRSGSPCCWPREELLWLLGRGALPWTVGTPRAGSDRMTNKSRVPVDVSFFLSFRSRCLGPGSTAHRYTSANGRTRATYATPTCTFSYSPPFFFCPSDPTAPFFSLNGAVRRVGGRYLEYTAVCCRLYSVVAPCRSTRYRTLLRVTRRSYHSPGCVDAYLFLFFFFSFSALRLDPVTLLFGRHTTPSAVPPDRRRPAGNATPHSSGQRFTLLEHTRTVHEKWREFCCPICNMGFSRRHKVVQVRFVGTPRASLFCCCCCCDF